MVEERETAESLRAEIAALSARIEGLRAELAEAEAHDHRLERIIEVVPGAVWESEGWPGQPTYRMPYVSGEVERIFGYTREECLQSPTFWTSIVHPDDTATVVRDLTKIAETGVGGRMSDNRFVTKDGREVWVEAHITLYHDASGAIVGRTVVAPDVTARVLAERSRANLLAQWEDLAQRLDNMIASVPGVVWEIRGRLGSHDQTPLFLSDYLETLVGYRAEEVLGEPQLWRELVHPDDDEWLGREVEKLYASGSGILQHRWVARDGRTVWVETHLRVIADEAGAPVGAYGVTMDITGRKLAEQERARLKEQARDTQAGALAELSTPILPISRDILILPLIGTIDEARAVRVIDALLDSVSNARAKVAIIDLSGARSVDAQTADALVRAAGAVKLLGAEVVLTGIRPEAAGLLVELTTGIHELTICGSLERGIAYAMSRNG